MDNSQNENNNLAFTRDQAASIIIAGIQAGAIRFPFSGAFDAKHAEEIAERNLGYAYSAEKTSDFLRSMESYAIAQDFANLARKDALYLLMLLQTLTVGISKEESERIIRRATGQMI